MILMGYEEYTSHIQAFPKDAAYLNIPIANYFELEKVCGEGHVTGDWAKAANSTTPLGVQQINLINEKPFSFIETKIEGPHQFHDWSNEYPSESPQQCSPFPDTRTIKRESSSTTKTAMPRKRSRDSD